MSKLFYYVKISASMAIEAKRKQNEPLNVFLRRFSEQVKRRGIVNQYKKARFYIKPKSRGLKKMDALERKKHSERLIYLKKIGKVKS